jgi:hypothetical protein
MASHGMAMTVWLCDVVLLEDPGGFWEELPFPDLLSVDLGRRAVRRLDWN